MKQKFLAVAVYFLIFSLFLTVIAEFNRLDHDMLHELSLARETLELGYVPWRDSFAYTATVYPVVHHEWGSGLLIYSLVILTGWGAAGLMALKLALSFATIGLTVRCSRRMGGDWMVIAALSLIAIVLSCIGFQTIRAQLFTLLFTAILLNLFVLDRRGSVRWTLVWLVLYVIWLNLHAGFLVGIGLFGCYLIERSLFIYHRQRSLHGTWLQTRHLYLTLAAMALLWLANPYLWHYGGYLVYAIRLDRPRVGEWSWIGADETSASVLLPTYGVALLLLMYAAAQRRWTQLPGLLMVLVTAWISFWHVRHISIFGLVWCAYVPGYLSRTNIGRMLRKPGSRSPILVSAVMIVVSALLLWKPVTARFWNLQVPASHELPELVYPVGVVNYLEQNQFTGNIMVPFSQGSYLSWKLAPAVKVSVDSRYEVAYDPEWVERTFQLYEARDGWPAVLEKYPTDAVLVYANAPLRKALEEQMPHQWHLRYQDPEFYLFFPAQRDDDYPREVREDVPEGVFP